MTKPDYHSMLYEANQVLARELVKRQAQDHRIARLQSVVTNLQNLCAEQDRKYFENRVERFVKKDLRGGITDSVRVILRENIFPMTAIQLKEKIEARKLQLTRYKSPLAVIHTVLKRLIQSGDVKVAYQWISSTDKALAQLQKTSEPPRAKRGVPKEMQ